MILGRPSAWSGLAWRLVRHPCRSLAHRRDRAAWHRSRRYGSAAADRLAARVSGATSDLPPPPPPRRTRRGELARPSTSAAAATTCTAR